VLSGAKAYFDYVNAHGGVNGRKIVYKIEDDQYDPSKTVQLTQKLVEQDGVFAIFNSVGTEHALAVRPYLNERKVPQVLVGSGATAIGGPQHVRYPWTMGLLPSFVGEGSIYGRLIAAGQPNAKIGVLYENDEYGQELLAGLKRGLGAHAKQIVDAESYALLDTDVASQVQSLKASGADTFVIFALPKQAIQAFIAASRLGWKPTEYVTSVSIDPAVMKIVQLNAPGAGVGATSTAFLHDPTNPTQKSSAGVKLYLQIMKRYLPSEDPNAVAHIYGMMGAYAFVDALKHAGKSPTRASLLHAVQHLDETNPFLLPGLKLATSPTNYFPIGRTYRVRYLHGYWNVLGKPLKTS
jgi:ABC-type branched-subunit amino acid transport system substrate-binding protein